MCIRGKILRKIERRGYRISWKLKGRGRLMALGMYVCMYVCMYYKWILLHCARTYFTDPSTIRRQDGIRKKSPSPFQIGRLIYRSVVECDVIWCGFVASDLLYQSSWVKPSQIQSKASEVKDNQARSGTKEARSRTNKRVKFKLSTSDQVTSSAIHRFTKHFSPRMNSLYVFVAFLFSVSVSFSLSSPCFLLNSAQVTHPRHVKAKTALSPSLRSPLNSTSTSEWHDEERGQDGS